MAMNEWQRAAPTPPTHLGRLLDGLVGRGYLPHIFLLRQRDGLVGRGHLPHIFLLRQRHRRDVGDLAHGTLHRLDRRRGCDRTIDLDVEVRCEGVGVRYRWREIE